MVPDLGGNCRRYEIINRSSGNISLRVYIVWHPDYLLCYALQ
jgi:hypothetical protein